MKTYNLDTEKIEKIGFSIKKRRQEKNISLSKIAEELDINAGYISKLENGNNTKSLNLFLLKAICKKLELDYIELLKDIGYLDKDLLTLNISEISKLIEIFGELKNKIGAESDLYKKFEKIFFTLLDEGYEDNLKVYEKQSDVPISQNYSEFILKNIFFENKNIKAFFKKKDNLENIEDGKYILANYNGKNLLAKFYTENDNIILVFSNENEKPILVKENDLKILGILYKAEEERRY